MCGVSTIAMGVVGIDTSRRDAGAASAVVPGRGNIMQESTGCTECPHRQSVSGACGHESAQALARELSEHPERGCPFAPGESPQG